MKRYRKAETLWRKKVSPNKKLSLQVVSIMESRKYKLCRCFHTWNKPSLEGWLHWWKLLNGWHCTYNARLRRSTMSRPASPICTLAKILCGKTVVNYFNEYFLSYPLFCLFIRRQLQLHFLAVCCVLSLVLLFRTYFC